MMSDVRYQNLLALSVRDHVGQIVNQVENSEWTYEGTCDRTGTLSFRHRDGWTLLFGDALAVWAGDLTLPEALHRSPADADPCDSFRSRLDSSVQQPSELLHALCAVVSQANAYILGFDRSRGDHRGDH